MSKLTSIFIAGAFVIAGGLTYAQFQMDEQGQGATINHGEHASHGASTL